MSSKLIQMCSTLLGRRHLLNAYEMNAGWLIPFVDKHVGGGKNCVNPCHSARLSCRWSLFVECKRWTDCISFHFISWVLCSRSPEHRPSDGPRSRVVKRYTCTLENSALEPGADTVYTARGTWPWKPACDHQCP